MRFFLFLASLVVASAAFAQDALDGIVINEVLPDPSGTTSFDTDGDGVVEDEDEFVELFNTAAGAVDISGWQFVEETNVFTFPPMTSVPANGFVVLARDYTGAPPSGYFALNSQGSFNLANAGDNIYLYDPGTDTYIEVAYGSATPGGDTNDGVPASATRVGSGEDFGNDTDGLSIQRVPDGSASVVVQSPTPFASNAGGTVTQPLVFTTPGDPNSAAGWRHLSPPVEGFDIDDLAGLNLVQGVPAGATNPPQYPTYGDNVFVAFDAAGFVPPATTDEVIDSGQGFFWYLYDRTFVPNPAPGNGTSVSGELSGFVMTATGTVPASDVTFSPPNYGTAGPARYFLVGNPFDQDLNVAGISSSPARQSVLQTWDPQAGSYVLLEAGTPNDVLPVWQGTIAELSDPTTAPTFTFAAASRTGSQATPIYGRPALLPDAVALRLTGTTTLGAEVSDHLAVLRFADGASAGWDLRDASKLMPPTAAYGLLAPTVQRGGAPWRAAVSTLPAETTTVPVQFAASDAGTFAIGADVTLPGGSSATLRDLVTGAVHDFTEGEYTFSANATDWTDRFEIALSFASTAGETGAGAAFRLGAPTPNPTSGEARLALTVGTAQTVRAAVYDALGREVAVLHDGPVAAGTPLALRVGTDGLAPGVYVIRAQGEQETMTRRLTVTR